MKCQQCGKVAVWSYDDGKINLCLDCNLKFQQAADMMNRRNAEMINYLAEQMEATVGLPGIIPRYKITPSLIHTGNTTFNNINVNNSTVGAINTGYVETIDVSLSVINDKNNNEIAKILKALTEEIIQNKEVKEKNKNDVLEQLAFISEELTKPVEHQKKSIMKSAYTVISNLLSNSANILAIWKTLEELIK